MRLLIGNLWPKRWVLVSLQNVAKTTGNMGDILREKIWLCSIRMRPNCYEMLFESMDQNCGHGSIYMNTTLKTTRLYLFIGAGLCKRSMTLSDQVVNVHY